MKPSREIIKISMKAVVINIYISINGENGLLIILYKILQCIFLKIIFRNISNLSYVLPIEFQSSTPVGTADTTVILESKSKAYKSAKVACLLESYLGKLLCWYWARSQYVHHRLLASVLQNSWVKEISHRIVWVGRPKDHLVPTPLSWTGDTFH